MSDNPNVPPQQPEPQPGHFPPSHHGQGQEPLPPQYPHPQQGQFQPPHQGQPYSPPYQQTPYMPQTSQPQQENRRKDHNRAKGRFGATFWIVGGLLAIVVLSNAFNGRGESILMYLGVAAALTGLYALLFKKPSWAGLPGQNAAIAVTVAGATSLFIGGIAAGADAGRNNTAAPETVSSAALEADAAAKLKEREDALVKAEAESAAKLSAREDAVKARETAIGGAEAAAAANIVKEGTWTVGKDIAPGTYRTTKELTTSCYWAITVTGSNGSDIIENDNVKGGFPQVVLNEGQTFESSRCGTWTKQ